MYKSKIYGLELDIGLASLGFGMVLPGLPSVLPVWFGEVACGVIHNRYSG